MNSDFFNLAGYISVFLWGVVPILWVIYAITGPRRWLCPMALMLAIVAFFFAKHNSTNYVNLIQPDRSEEIAAQQAQEEASRQAIKDSRGKDLSDVRFAEDSASDSLDRAGMEQDGDKSKAQTMASSLPSAPA